MIVSFEPLSPAAPYCRECPCFALWKINTAFAAEFSTELTVGAEMSEKNGFRRVGCTAGDGAGGTKTHAAGATGAGRAKLEERKNFLLHLPALIWGQQRECPQQQAALRRQDFAAAIRPLGSLLKPCGRQHGCIGRAFAQKCEKFATGTEEEVMNAFRRVRDEIRRQVREFFEHEFA
jgi:hypothetical protein